MIPTFGLTNRFFIPSMRLLRGRSGISGVRSSSSCRKPAHRLGRTVDAGTVRGRDHQERRCPDEGASDLGDVVGFLGGDVGQRLGINLREIVQLTNGVGIVPVYRTHLIFLL